MAGAKYAPPTKSVPKRFQNHLLYFPPVCGIIPLSIRRGLLPSHLSALHILVVLGWLHLLLLLSGLSRSV